MHLLVFFLKLKNYLKQTLITKKSYQIFQNKELFYKNVHYLIIVFFEIIINQNSAFELQERVYSQKQNFLNTQFFLRPVC